MQKTKTYLKLAAILFTVFSTLSASAKEENYDLGGFDVFLSPGLTAGIGSYDMGTRDKGSYVEYTWGGKVGLKLGPLLLGGEYMEGSNSGGSDKVSVPDSIRITYPEPTGQRSIAYGVTAGLILGKLFLWGTTYPFESLSNDIKLSGVDYKHEFFGAGYTLAASYNVWNYIHAGIYYHYVKYDKYSSDHPTDTVTKAALPESWSGQTYGIYLSYVLPVSKIKEISKKK